MPAADTTEHSVPDQTSPPMPRLRQYCLIVIYPEVTPERLASLALRVPAETLPSHLHYPFPLHPTTLSAPSLEANPAVLVNAAVEP